MKQNPIEEEFFTKDDILFKLEEVYGKKTVKDSIKLDILKEQL